MDYLHYIILCINMYYVLRNPACIHTDHSKEPVILTLTQHPETCNNNTARIDTTASQGEEPWEPTTPEQVEPTEASHSQHEQVAANPQ